MFKVNQEFKHSGNNVIYVIKGAWDGKHPENDHAFLIRKNGTGHAYSGKVTKVGSVWNITNEEFTDMCGGNTSHFDKEMEINQQPKC